MKGQLTLRLPEPLLKKVEKICAKEGNRSAASFCAEAVSKLVKEKENPKDE